MSPTELAKDVKEIASTAVAQARALREKHNIKIVNILENQSYMREEQQLSIPLIAYLEHRDLKELKRLHAMARAGESSAWLQETHSLRKIFENLEATAPGNGDKQSYIKYFKRALFSLPRFIDECLIQCKSLAIDPDTELKDVG